MVQRKGMKRFGEGGDGGMAKTALSISRDFVNPSRIMTSYFHTQQLEKENIIEDTQTFKTNL